MEDKKVINEADFFSGVFAILASRGHEVLLYNQTFEKAMADIFREFKEHARQNGAEMRFRIRLHPLHGDSKTIHHGVASATQRGILSLDSPGNQLRIKMTKEEVDTFLATLPNRELFTSLANRITELFF